MDLVPTLDLGLWNGWLLCAPMLLSGLVLVLPRPDVARRMSDMSGYRCGERAATVGASLAPYALVALAAWTPLSGMWLPLIAGTAMSLAGTAGFTWTLLVFRRTPADRPIEGGPFRVSRNPLYVSGSLVFLGLAVATWSLPIAAGLAAMLVIQHGMILAEERVCRDRYGEGFARYCERVPRYLLC